MTTITAKYRIVTPMFIGDADQKAASLRPPSIKGALRFWWRALNWGRCLQQTGTVNDALKLLYQEERRLFGTAAVIENQQALGQGLFLLQIHQQPQIVTDATWPINNTGSGYLGFGLMESGSPAKNNYQPHRQAIREAVDFSLELRFKPNTHQVDREQIIATLHAWSLFGGLGSRVRRGFGSITLLELDNQDALLDQTVYEKAAEKFLGDTAEISGFPPYTAFSRHTRFSILANGKSARETHNQVGLLYKAHRGQASTLRGVAKIPFGLPLQGVDLESRRASPLIFHIHALRDHSFAAAVLYLPGEFHHDSRYQTADLGKFYREVTRFLPMEPQA